MTERDLQNRENVSSATLPAIGQLKRDLLERDRDKRYAYGYGAPVSPASRLLLNQAFVDKGYDPLAIRSLAQSLRPRLGKLVTNLVLGLDGGEIERTDAIDNTYSFYSPSPGVSPLYRGTAEENTLIDGSIKASDHKNSQRRQQTGQGASRFMDIQATIPSELQTFVPIVVLGGGPAGMITARSLLNMGFLNITVLDKAGKYNGIWRHPNVGSDNVSKNNPFDINYSYLPPLKAAPGPGSDVVKFLNHVRGKDDYFLRNLPDVTRATVTAVKPGDLHHTVHFTLPTGEKKTLSAPIVINTLGNGTPLPPSREGYMTTDTPELAGMRWQQVITPEIAEKYRGKTLVFIGLGNSTSEMVMQVQQFNRQGFNIDYRILTHYPEAAVQNPLETVMENGRAYRVHRDKTVPNLVRWEGDLPDAGRAYSQALDQGKIIADIGEWHMDKKTNTLQVKRKDGTALDPIRCDKLFTLIGYGHDAETLEKWGLTPIDPASGTIAADYDGEVQRNPGVTGRERIYPGYFANGAMLRSATNPNAPVIPGIMFRTPDLIFSTVVRATEYYTRKYEGFDLDKRINYLNIN